jgi:hypothetical protein
MSIHKQEESKEEAKKPLKIGSFQTPKNRSGSLLVADAKNFGKSTIT